MCLSEKQESLFQSLQFIEPLLGYELLNQGKMLIVKYDPGKDPARKTQDSRIRGSFWSKPCHQYNQRNQRAPFVKLIAALRRIQLSLIPQDQRR